MPGGVSGDVKYRNPYPVFLKRASGSHIFDVDNNEYIDYNLSYGALILGHGHSAVKNAISDTLSSVGTILFGNPSVDEIEYGEILINTFMKHGEIRFTNSGMEATTLAVRLAMAFTGRRKIAKFDGHYHGANPLLLVNYKPKIMAKDENGHIIKEPDSYEITGDLFDETVVLPFNDIDGTREALENKDVAAIIMEPFEDGYIPAQRDFLAFLRNYTKEKGIILIFDEVKTGFRIRIGGASEFYNMEPDITCLGKIIGGGTPIGAVIGRADIMNLLNPGVKEKKVFHSGTFNGNPLSMRLGMATINELRKDNNFERIIGMSASLRKILSEVLDDFGLTFKMYGEGGFLNFITSKVEVKTRRDIPESAKMFRKLIDSALLESGIYSIPNSRLSMSLAHTDEDFEETGKAFRVSLKKAIDEAVTMSLKLDR